MPLALVTGASTGIGREVAEELARRGYDLILVARAGGELERETTSWQEHYRVRVRCEAVDLADSAELDGLCARLGEVPDVLVNNAGIGDLGPFHAAQWERLDQLLRVNVLALTHLTHHLLPAMRARGSGRILNVASSAAFSPGPLMAVYFATKAFVLHLSEALASECAGSGVTVTALCPGATTTEFHKAAGFSHDHILFRPPLASHPAQVARYGVRALLAGRRVAVPGLLNRLSLVALHLVPRGLAVGLTHWVLRH